MALFLKTWGSLIVALVALVQPWAIGLWKRVFRQGDLEVFESGPVDIGYSPLGATLGLMGTLRAVHKDQFVYKVTITVKRLKDGAQHTFDWAAFRPARITLGQPTEQSIEVVSAFMVTTTQPYRFNLLFIDNGLQKEFEPYLTSIREQWNATVHARVMSGSPQDSSSATQASIEAAYQEFTRAAPFTDTVTAVDRLFYWTAGQYEITTVVLTTELEITEVFSIEITDRDSTLLRLNAARVVDAACNRQGVQFNFAYVTLQDVPKNPI